MTEDILASVREVMAGRLGLDLADLDDGRAFVDLGGDSLSLLAAVRDLEQRFGVRVPMRVLFEGADTASKLASFLTATADTAQAAQANPQRPAGQQQRPPGGPGLELVARGGPEWRSAGPAEQGSAPVAGKAPGLAGGPGHEPGPVGHGQVTGGGIASDRAAILAAQLEVAEHLVTAITGVMSKQLDALAASPPGGSPPERRAGDSVPPRPAGPLPGRPAEPASGSGAPGQDEVASPHPGTPPVRDGAAPLEGKPAQLVTQPARPAGEAGAAADFSLYFFGDYPAQNEPNKYQAIIAAAEYADRNLFHTVWLPERHFHSFGAIFPNPSVLAAALAVRTSRIRLHAGSVVLPLHSPFRVVEEWSVVDNLSGGRVGLCFASGWSAKDFVLAPDVYGRQRDVLYEHLQTVRTLWDGNPVRAPSGSGDPVDVTVYPRPLQPRPPLFVAVLGNPESFRMAGRHDLGVVTNLMTQGLDDLAANIRRYREARAESGLAPDGGRVVVLVHTYLHHSQAEARREARAPFRDYLRSSMTLFDNMANSLGYDVDLAKASPDDLEYLLDHAFDRYCAERAMIGSLADGAGFADRLLAAGADEIACFIDFGVPPDRMLAGLPLLTELQSRVASHPAPRRDLADAPASPLQRRMWLIERMEPGTSAYHEPKALLLQGPLREQDLADAFQQVVVRHPQLRTVFRETTGELRQVELADVPADCPVVDSGGLDAGAVLASFADEHQGFDLAAGPLFRARLIRLDAERHLLLFVAHHIIFDSFSTEVLYRDLGSYYRGEAKLLPPPPVSRPQPAGAPSAHAGEFWRGALAEATAMRLPADHPRDSGPLPATVAARAVHEIGTELAERVRALAKDRGCTLFMALVGALGTMLGRFCNTDDVLLGAAVSNRPPDGGDIIGMFVETLVFRLDLSGDPRFPELLRRVREWAGRAYEHRDVPFDEVVSMVNPDRVAGMNPLVQVMVEFEKVPHVAIADDLTCRVLDVPRAQAPFDLTFYLSDGAGPEAAGIGCAVEYNARLFEPSSVRRMLDYFEVILQRAVQSPAARLSALAGLTPADEAALAGFEGDGLELAPECLHAIVNEQANRIPGAIAVDGIGEPLTYRELMDRATRLARSLSAEGVGPGDLVAVLLPRGPDLIVALLGVLTSGAGYVPVDPSLPQNRVRLILSDSHPALLLTNLELDTSVPLRGVADLVCRYPDEPDLDRAGQDRARPVDAPEAMSADAVAYCIYTSGSAGRPKGVLVPHRGPANVIRSHLREHRPLSTLQWTSPAFDVSVQEIFTTLGSGATLTLVPDEERYDPRAVFDRVRAHRVQRLFMPATPLHQLVAACPHVPSVEEIFVAGERLVITPRLRAFLQRNPRIALYNQYGPTEGSIIATSQRVAPHSETAPTVGRPIPHVTVRILDSAGRPVPVGAVGEIRLGGAAPAAGYLGDPELTQERFRGGRYRTGDLGRWRPDGALDLVGRIDDQVKIRGYRVEPGEACAALERLPQVRDAAVITREGPGGDPQLAAYVVPAAPLPEDWVATLRAALAEHLPGYLIPSVWARLDELPVTVNGKLAADQLRRLPAEAAAETGPPPEAALSPAEEALTALWCAELKVAAVPADRRFFDAGGDSLMMVRLLERIRQRFGRHLPVREFMQDPTIGAVARWLRS